MKSVEIFVAGSPYDSFPPDECFSPVLQKRDSFPRYGVFSALRTASKADFVGFSTAEEYLCFSPQTKLGKDAKFLEEDHFSKTSLQTHGLNQSLVSCIEGYDLIISPLQDLRAATVQAKLDDLVKEELAELLALLEKNYPEYAELASAYCKGRLYRTNSLFVMKRELFDTYTSFLFNILDSFYLNKDISSYSKAQMLALDELGHLITQVFIMHVQQDTSRQIQIRSCVRFKEYHTPLSLKAIKKDAVVVVFASNEHFAPFLGVCFRSMLEQISAENFYDVVVLESDISEDSKHRLNLMAKLWPNVNLRFYNPTAMLSGKKLQKNSADHISMETYYRFLIPEILPEYDKALYLDCDAVILDDVANLFATDLHGHALGAAIDPEIPAQRMHEPSFEKYLQDVLGLKSEDPYLQAGVLVMDITAMKSIHSVEEWLRLAGERTYRYNDQDILNKECKGHLHLLDGSWNVVVNCNNRRLPIIEKGPHAVLDAYLRAREEPKFVHYAGFEKPWDAPFSDFAYLFWDFASRSSFSDRVLAMRVWDHSSKKKRSMVDTLFPRGTKRRVFAKKIFYRMSGT